MALRGPSNIKGKVSVQADDGTGSITRKKGPAAVPVFQNLAVGPSVAVAHGSDWFVVRGWAHAIKAMGAPGPASASSTSTVTSEFELTAPDRKIALHTELSIWATLTDAGTASIEVSATITPLGPGVPIPINKTYGLKLDPADPTGQTIKITGGKPDKMKNGSHQTEKEPPGAVAHTPLRKGKYKLEFTVTVESSGDVEHVTVQEAHLYLH